MTIDIHATAMPFVEGKDRKFYSPGLTKLEYAAVHIMSGLAADGDYEGTQDHAAGFAVYWARALFAELEKGE